MDEPSEFLTVPEVASRMRVSAATIRRMIDQGELPAIKFGKQYRVDAAELQQTVAACRVSRPVVAR